VFFPSSQPAAPLIGAEGWDEGKPWWGASNPALKHGANENEHVSNPCREFRSGEYRIVSRPEFNI